MGQEITYCSNCQSGHKLQAPAPLIVEPKPIVIGAGMNNSGDQIDEVRIYNRALLAAEIAALAKANKP